ncbi:RimJ/RimL family protein N-acetyltransferase [Kitasatospora sp. MAP12-15]|uniref:GNAT family N-acetyltransferase n=1 Tax=unclassified Kitasatospora TaxID=2633591 RepID=UPI00247547E5|nr:GNAT family protein [Kitasatospora sp. MAP12-44]MDH6110775.1 RimJ/RimL family protein N-acetyltransferase [Kitasatospora sp. MAP12-44]
MPYTILPPDQSALPVLETERLLLRAPEPADVDAIDRACQDEAIQRWTVVPSPYRREDAEFFVHQLAPDGLRTGGNLIWCVLEKETGTLVGTQALTARGPGAAEVGFWATEESRGRGYTVEALLAVARWAFTERELRRLEWVAFVGNEPSLALARRAGFTIEGTLRSYAAQRGEYQDAWIGSLLPADLAG